jgi:hypothetical protein
MASMGENKSACRVLVGKPEGRRPFGRPRCGLKDNIKLILKKWDARGRCAWSGFMS